jgi:hypothetical protein
VTCMSRMRFASMHRASLNLIVRQHFSPTSRTQLLRFRFVRPLHGARFEFGWPTQPSVPRQSVSAHRTQKNA